MKDTHQSSSCSNQERFLSILRSWLISIQKLIICCLLSEEQEHTERWVLSGRLGNQPLLGGECYFHTISRADRHTNTENSHIHVTLWHSTLLWPGNKMCLCVALMRHTDTHWFTDASDDVGQSDCTHTLIFYISLLASTISPPWTLFFLDNIQWNKQSPSRQSLLA